MNVLNNKNYAQQDDYKIIDINEKNYTLFLSKDSQ